jgi:2-oxoglutarate dehydrogenase E2 component (dihydrolipoamide succinyltransferase)
MLVEVKIPEVGESIVEVQIGQWLKTEGEAVQKDESLVVIESEKANFELPAPQSGKLSRILRQAGELVKVGATIAQIDSDGAASQPRKGESRSAEQSALKAAPPVQPRGEAGAPAPSRSPTRPLIPANEERSTSYKSTTAQATGPEERPSETPITAPAPPTEAAGEGATPPERAAVATEAGPPPQAQGPATVTPDREEEVVPMSMLRRTVARRLVEAQRTMAMLTTFNEVDLSAVQALRQQHQEAFQRRYGIKLGLMSFFVKAAIAALKEFPQLNAEVRGDDIHYRNYFDIGVAIATPQGLVVPVLANAERLSFAEVESAISDFARRAKERQLKPEELEGGTFTITNGGVFGSLLSTPLINPPQSGILGLHAIEDRPVAREGRVVIRPMMYVALTYDHRIVDGREAVLFLRRIKEVVEAPARMLIEV